MCRPAGGLILQGQSHPEGSAADGHDRRSKRVSMSFAGLKAWQRRADECGFRNLQMRELEEREAFSRSSQLQSTQTS